MTIFPMPPPTTDPPLRAAPLPVLKATTGIAGFDDISGGGLPRGRTTLLVGGPGSGKTIFAMHFLMEGAKFRDEPGIFVAFEESPARIASNVAGFGWQLEALRPEQLVFVDAHPEHDLVQSGNFDLGGLLAALEAQARAIGARRIVLDAMDVMLALLPDAAARRREVYRLHDWLTTFGLTALITAKADGDGDGDGSHGLDQQQPFGLMQFMVDCAVVLTHSVSRGVSQRNLRVQKYRGSAFDENEAPFVIGRQGFDIAIARKLGHVDAAVSDERVGSGIARLDTMLGGGYYRGATVLITGFPGTAKTTLSGAFAEAACGRGERTLFVSFDSDGSEIVRNLASVNIQLERHVASGLLRMVSARTIIGSAETFLARIETLAREHAARCLVIDPVSTLSKVGNELTAHAVAERLIDWSKADGLTLVCTSLLDELTSSARAGSSPYVSSLADTWLHLSFLVQAGERNRGLSIIKSRGTAHSNQVRELVLGNEGVTLEDVYTAGGEVLMGTLRWEKEREVRLAKETAEAAARLKRVRLDTEEAELEVRVKSLQTELIAKRVEKSMLARATESSEGEVSRGPTHRHELRGADDAPALPLD